MCQHNNPGLAQPGLHQYKPPECDGAFAVFEPCYLELFRSLQASSASAAGIEPSFGHILAGSAAPPALMQSSVGGLPPIGVCATVKQINQLDNGRLQVGTAGRPACAHRRARQCLLRVSLSAHASTTLQMSCLRSTSLLTRHTYPYQRTPAYPRSRLACTTPAC